MHGGKKQGTERGCCHQSSLGDTQITQNPSIHAGTTCMMANLSALFRPFDCKERELFGAFSFSLTHSLLFISLFIRVSGDSICFN